MKTIPELLRDADPLRYERPWTANERQTIRQIVTTPQPVERVPRRMITIAAGIALALIATAAIGSHLWWRASVDLEAAVRFEVRLAQENPATGLQEAAVSDSGRVYLHQEVVVTNGDIAQAQIVQGDTASRFGVTVMFTADGATKIFKATKNHIGKPLAILLDGKVVVAPVVRGPISTSAVITGNYTKAEAERIVSGIVGR